MTAYCNSTSSFILWSWTGRRVMLCHVVPTEADISVNFRKKSDTLCICVTWIIRMCDVSYSHAQHNSFLRATWIIHTYDSVCEVCCCCVNCREKASNACIRAKLVTIWYQLLYFVLVRMMKLEMQWPRHVFKAGKVSYCTLIYRHIVRLVKLHIQTHNMKGMHRHMIQRHKIHTHDTWLHILMYRVSICGCVILHIQIHNSYGPHRHMIPRRMTHTHETFASVLCVCMRLGKIAHTDTRYIGHC